MSPADETDRPNVLWLIAENMGSDLACYGERLATTPNVDRLASEGVLYRRFYTSGAVCSPSRSAIIPGMYQTTIGAHNHRSHRRDGYRLPDGVDVIMEPFRKAGYFTANVVTAAPGVRGTGKTDFNFHVDKPFDGTDWNQRAKDQPFYAQVNFNQTHIPFQKAKENPVDPEKVILPPYYPDHPLFRDQWAKYLDTVGELDRKVGAVLKRLGDEGLSDNTIVFFFSDHGADFPRGEPWLYDSGIRVPLIVRIPKRLRNGPIRQQAEPGRVSDELISSIDLAATSLALCDIDRPSKMQGRPFLGAGIRPRKIIFSARDRYDETVDRIRCVCTNRFKYIRNFFPDQPYMQRNRWSESYMPTYNLLKQLHHDGKLTPDQLRHLSPHRPPEELYDLANDPHELNNLAGSAEHQQVLSDLRAELDKWIKRTGDQGAIAEAPAALKYWLNEMEKQFGGHQWKPRNN